jgi:starch-binding outer membrane protein, SusD/RagB family
MKKTKIFSIVLIFTALLMSCKDSFLDQPPLGAYTESQLNNAAGINGYIVGTYSVLNGVMIITSPEMVLFSDIHSDEALKGSTAGDQPAFLEFSNYNVTTGNSNVLSLWRWGYDGVARCNQTLKAIALATDLTDANKTILAAETRFLRGHFYFILKRSFKNIPWIDETSTTTLVPNTVDNDGVTYVDCWPQIIADFDYARTNLPATQTDLGRPNKWAAAAYYAKTLIFRANENGIAQGYTDALTVLNDVIANGKNAAGVAYGLEANYYDLFNVLKENGKEIVWDVQQSANDGTVNGQNGGMLAQWVTTQNANGPGLGLGIGFYQPTPWFADMFRTSGKGLPYLDFFATYSRRLKDDMGLAAAPASGTDPFVVDTIGVDPRLDWTITRRGIPCLDFGNMPGATWIRDQPSSGPYMTKKFYILKSQYGTYTYTGNANTALNSHIIRFADVLLLAAECEARVGSLSNARDLVNRVRLRMVNNSSSASNWVKKTDGSNAANYRIKAYPTGGANDPFQSQTSALNAILFERALELGTEGHRFWDVTRFGKGEEIFNAYVASEKGRYTQIKDAVYTDRIDRALPIPQTAIDRSRAGAISTLTQNPGY